jgi:formamidopyrimidine-DNA glycosylase
MPELIEVEIYRRTAERMLHRPIAAVEASDLWFLKEQTTPHDLAEALVGETFTAARRIGKLLILNLSSGPALGLRFGMTGRLVVDGVAGIDELLYSSHKTDPRFIRFAVKFSDGGQAEISDPRRLGGVALDPALDGLGPDAASITFDQLEGVLAGSSAAVKARLLDQSRVAGIGNLIADEVLWRAGLSPLTPAMALGTTRVAHLHHHLQAGIADLTQRGGSHLGDLMEGRGTGGQCPRCGVALRVDRVGGRTTYWCAVHQT